MTGDMAAPTGSTHLHRRDAPDRPGAVSVLHVTTCAGGGVPQAILDHISATPQFMHSVLWPSANDELDGHDVAIKYPMPQAQVRRYARIREIVARVRPQIVVAHSSLAGLLTRLSPRSGYALIYQPHGYAFEAPHRPAWQRAGIRGVEAVLGRRADIVVGITPHELRLAEELGARKALMIPNCSHATAAARRTVEARPRGRFTVVTSGRIAPQKDPAFFARVAAAVKSVVPEAIFTWIGDGDGRLRSVLTAAGVEVTGWMMPEDAWREMSTASLYMHTATYEGFPLTVVDAATLGLPLALRHIPAFEGFTGYELTDEDGLARFVERFAAGDVATVAAAGDASLRVSTACTVEAQRRQVLAAYDDALRGSEAPSRRAAWEH